MPLYQYQCGCGLRFESQGSMANHADPKKCPECEKMAERQMPETVAGVFNQEVSGPIPQNTGISSIDTHIDRVIGQSAEQGRKAHVARVDTKKELLRNNPDATGYDITKTPDGEFTLMSKDQRKARETALAVNNKAMNAIEQEKVKPAPK